ncbi:hypothetical protein BJ912DRAFT_924753 [Pholiota molesta]|nr:hypothetical protein BJ912DRAFT_924753 [Pholiota molesta]
MWYYCQEAQANFLYIALELCPAQRRMGPPAVLCAFQCLAIAMSRGAGSSTRISTVLASRDAAVRAARGSTGCFLRVSVFEHHYVALRREGDGPRRWESPDDVMRLGCVFLESLVRNGVYCAQLSSLPPILRVLDELGEERGCKMRGMDVCPGSRTVYG